MRSYNVYHVHCSEDGMIGIYSTKKKAFERAAEYITSYDAESECDVDTEYWDGGNLSFATFTLARPDDVADDATYGGNCGTAMVTMVAVR